jgi:hypothetical protein
MSKCKKRIIISSQKFFTYINNEIIFEDIHQQTYSCVKSTIR